MRYLKRAQLAITAFMLSLVEITLGWFEKHYTFGLDTAFQTQYRQEFIATYEQRQSLLRDTVTTEAVI